MLPIFTSVLVLVGAGSLVVAAVGRIAMRRLGLELWTVVLWLGLAEEQDRRALVR